MASEQKKRKQAFDEAYARVISVRWDGGREPLVVMRKVYEETEEQVEDLQGQVGRLVEDKRMLTLSENQLKELVELRNKDVEMWKEESRRMGDVAYQRVKKVRELQDELRALRGEPTTQANYAIANQQMALMMMDKDRELLELRAQVGELREDAKDYAKLVGERLGDINNLRSSVEYWKREAGKARMALVHAREVLSESLERIKVTE